jgi:hypothetical protein
MDEERETGDVQGYPVTLQAGLSFFNDSMPQFFQQRFRLLQIFGVEPFSEPVVDFR